MFRCGLCRNFSLYKPLLFFVEQGIFAYDHKSCARLTNRFGLARAQECTSETIKQTMS